MTRFQGQSNAYDIPNNVIYMGDLLFSWDIGDPITVFTLGGTTVPTLAVDGRIKLYEATNANDQPSWCYITIPNTKGRAALIFHAIISKQADDTSTDNISFALQIGPNPGAPGIPIGMTYWVDGSVPRSNLLWRNLAAAGTTLNIVFNPTAGVEYAVDLLMTDKEIIVLVNNVKLTSILINTLGNATLSAHPLKDWFTADKQILLWVRHDAGQVSHYRVRDIRVSRLVGQS